jgi:hypothetical protein
MESVPYSKFTGIDSSTDPEDASAVSFLKLDNFILNRKLGRMYVRGGSKSWAVTGDILGIGGYARDTGTSRIPVSETIVRHRRIAAITYIEKLNWSANTWDAITQGIHTSFDVADTTSFAQISELLAVCGGRPGKIRDISSGSLERLGGPAPTAAPSLTTYGTGLTGTYSYVYTFRDSATAWESSPSPATSLLTVANKTITVGGLETTCAREGVNKIRIYRTVSTGEAPYLYVGEIDLGTTAYDDTLVDDPLGVTAPDFGDHNPPPTNSYLVYAHEDRLWMVDSNDPTKLYYSKPFAGEYRNLEYFSEDRTEVFPKRITGLMTRPGGGLLIFQPPGFGIWELSGRTESEFTLQIQYPKEGTNFKDSVCTNGELVAFWAEDGPAWVNGEGVTRQLSFKSRNDIRSALLQEFNNSVQVWGVWSNAAKQFLFHFSGSDTGASQWYDESTGLAVPWMNTDTGEIVPWMYDEASPPPSGGNWWGATWYGGAWYGGAWI